MFIISSTLVLLLIAAGLYFRHKPKIHIPIMSTAFIIDVVLVLIIELQRKAIETVIDSAIGKPSIFVLIHALISLTVLLLYSVLAYTGNKIHKGERELIKLHRNLAAIFILLRLANYVTSLDMHGFVVAVQQ